MALFKSHVLTQASGSVAGLTYSRSRAGLVLRNRSTPVNRQTSRQLAVRNAITILVNTWTETLTQAQRNRWNVYAANVPITNRLGDQRTTTGQNWFIASNTPRIQAHPLAGFISTIVTLAPVTFTRGDYSTPTFVADAAAGIDIAFDDTDPFNSSTENALLVYMHRPANRAQRSPHNHSRLVATIGNGEGSPFNISPVQAANNAFPLNTGNAIALSFVQTLNTGQLAAKRTVGPVLVT